MANAAGAGRLPIIDLLKFLASQLIVWHHLVLYGPMAGEARHRARELFDWLTDDARAAVYAFLVIAGFLSASVLLPRPGAPAAIVSVPAFVGRVVDRYRRLAPPYLVAVALAILVACLARRWMRDSDTPAPPALDQVLAHVLMLHDLLGFDALSAGVWYVAIDLQLFVMLALMAVFAQRAGGYGRPVAILLVLTCVLAGWFAFSSIGALDDFAIYFFGAYGLGVIARWSRNPPLPAVQERRAFERWSPERCAWAALLMALGALLLLVRPGPRESVAVATALLLALAPSRQGGWLSVPWLVAASRQSYSLFVIHYPVCLLGNALYWHYAAGTSLAAMTGLVLTWVACNLAAMALHRRVEAPLLRSSSGSALARSAPSATAERLS